MLPKYKLLTQITNSMFDFENLEVYKKSKALNKEVLDFLRCNKQIDSFLRDQLKRAAISATINIVEGKGE